MGGRKRASAVRETQDNTSSTTSNKKLRTGNNSAEASITVPAAAAATERVSGDINSSTSNTSMWPSKSKKKHGDANAEQMFQEILDTLRQDGKEAEDEFDTDELGMEGMIIP